MSYSHGSWSPKGDGQFPDPAQVVGGSSRRVDHGDQQPFAYVGGYTQSTHRGNIRPSSASPTSSLSGAMGEAHISSHQHPAGMAWPVPQSGYPDESPMVPYMSAPPTPASASPSGAFSLYQYQSQYNQQQQQQHYSNPNNESFPHNIPSPLYAEQFASASQQSRAQAMMQSVMTPSTPVTPSSAGVPMSLTPNPIPTTISIGRSSRQTRESMEDQLGRLQQRVHELEVARDAEAQRAHHLQQELNRVTYGMAGTASGSALPSPLPTPVHPQAVEENWRARTEARKKIFCSVNRAGNALCAWHDSRRERRAYPPRNAPPGVLNCGCTYEEALFEESLARHGVGSYHPGESVRMDPALRNPLLRLLQERYNYRDGDFDFDPVTRTWLNGEDAAYWEARLASGAANTRKTRGEERR